MTDDLEKSNREEKIDKLINKLIGSQEQWTIDMNKKITKWRLKYEKELEDYEFVYNVDEFYQLKMGGYIRYFNLNDELRWGGILLKKVKNNEINLMILANSDFKRFTVSFDRNYVFYKSHKTQSDKNRKIFLTYLNKYDD